MVASVGRILSECGIEESVPSDGGISKGIKESVRG